MTWCKRSNTNTALSCYLEALACTSMPNLRLQLELH